MEKKSLWSTKFLTLAGVILLEGLILYLLSDTMGVIPRINAWVGFFALAFQEIPLLLLFPTLFGSLSQAYMAHGFVIGGPCLAATLLTLVLYDVFWPNKHGVFLLLLLFLLMLSLVGGLILYSALRRQEANRVQNAVAKTGKADDRPV